jgi:LPXTG-motif cell wall-anchored protein
MGMKTIRRSVAVALLCAASAGAQCAICYRTAQALSGARGRVLNSGILILGAPPLALLTGFVFLLRRRNRA